MFDLLFVEEYGIYVLVFQGAAVTDRMHCRLTIPINIDCEYLLLYYRWIAGLLVWITIYAVLTSIGFCKFKIIFFGKIAKIVSKQFYFWQTYLLVFPLDLEGCRVRE